MLLTCPHCTDIAEIPNIFRKFYGMPIACHACTGIFYVPKRIADPTRQSVRQDHQKIRCASCRVTLMIPAVAGTETDKFAMQCPACKKDIPASQINRIHFHILRMENLLPVLFGGCIGALIVYMNQQGMLGVYPDIMLAKIQSLFASVANYADTMFPYLS